jgi:chromosome segregation ATPase
VFFSAAERVHTAKAGAEAERSALRRAAARAEVTLTSAEDELVEARAAANKARAERKQCGPDCRTKLATEVSAQADVEAARQGLLQAQRKAIVESPFKAPVWLLRAALDLVAFMAIWTGLSGWPQRSH